MITLALLLLFAAPETPKPAGHGTADGLKLTVDAEEARKAGRVDDAIRLYRRALEVDVSSKDDWWALGTLYYQKDRYPECRDAFNHLSRLDPNSGVAWSMLGLCDFGTKNYTEALMHLERGRELGTGIEAIRRVDGSLGHLLELFETGIVGAVILGVGAVQVRFDLGGIVVRRSFGRLIEKQDTHGADISGFDVRR